MNHLFSPLHICSSYPDLVPLGVSLEHPHSPLQKSKPFFQVPHTTSHRKPCGPDENPREGT